MKIVSKVERDCTLEQIREHMLGEGVSSLVVAMTDEKDITEVYKIEKVYKIEEYLEIQKPAKKMSK